MADDATVWAYRAKRHPELPAEREEGRVEGHAEGLEEGLQRGRIQMLRRVLSVKFGVIDPELEARIVAASPDVLDRYLVRILTAATVAAVFDD